MCGRIGCFVYDHAYNVITVTHAYDGSLTSTCPSPDVLTTVLCKILFESILKIQDKDTFQKYSEDTTT